MPKTVQLSDAAYRTLTLCKRGNESYSDVVLRLAGEKKDIASLQRLGPTLAGYDYGEARRKMDAADRERWEDLEKRRKPRHP
ncbi:MAG: antitoxin VapB family protein [Thermoplasmatota archaeon]